MFITKDLHQYSKYNSYYEIDIDFSTELNTYHLGDQLGSGGNGAVYECIDNHGNICAVKFLLSLNRKAKLRFEQEVGILCKLNHPHIVKYIDNGSILGKDK